MTLIRNRRIGTSENRDIGSKEGLPLINADRGSMQIVADCTRIEADWPQINAGSGTKGRSGGRKYWFFDKLLLGIERVFQIL